MIWVWILIGFVVGEGSIAGVWYWMKKKRKRQKEVQDKGRVVIPLRDMVQLANINTAMDVGYLMLEYKINLKIPEFYDKYMNLVKKQKELYFRELIEIFSHNKKEYVRDLLDKYAGFSTQDVLLLLMCEMQLDNKTMARIMGLTLETLKKRKTRMRIKMRTASPVTLYAGVAGYGLRWFPGGYLPYIVDKHLFYISRFHLSYMAGTTRRSRISRRSDRWENRKRSGR